MGALYVKLLNFNGIPKFCKKTTEINNTIFLRRYIIP